MISAESQSFAMVMPIMPVNINCSVKEKQAVPRQRCYVTVQRSRVQRLS
jgi:hypothetical protein